MNQVILAKKQETVKGLTDLLSQSHSVVVVAYSNLPVDEINKLRRSLKENGAKLSVQKNTLMKKAVDSDGLQALDGCFKGPNAIVTSSEEGAGLAVLNEFKDSHKNFAIKGGIIGGTYCDEARLSELAAIGTKENALSALLSTLQSPLVHFALTLKALGEKAEN